MPSRCATPSRPTCLQKMPMSGDIDKNFATMMFAGAQTRYLHERKV